jgi:hypothetical protein
MFASGKVNTQMKDKLYLLTIGRVYCTHDGDATHFHQLDTL